MAQAPVRRRTAAPAGRQAPAARPAARGGSSQYRGEAGMRKAEEEIAKSREREKQRREQGHMPFRFRVPVGETRQAVVLDDKPDFFQYEHNAKGPDGKWNVFSGCIKETENCPGCAALGKEGYYALYLTVLDLTPFETRNGETVEFSRKLLVVKNQQQKKFMRLWEKEGTLRGMILDFTRDGDKEPSIGNDIEQVDWMDQKELSTYVREYVDRERKKRVEDCSEPFDYEKLFPEPTAASLRALFGGDAPAGSREAEERELGRTRGSARRAPRGDDWEDPDAEEQYGKEAAEEAPARRGAPARRSAPARGKAAEPRYAEEDIDPESGLPYEDAVPLEDDADGGDDAPAETPARVGRRAPPARRAAREEPVSEEPEDDDEAAEEAPARPARRTAAPARRGAPARRAAREEPEAEEPATPRRVTFRKPRA